MGIKSTMASVSYAANHQAAARAAGRNVAEMHGTMLLRCSELVRDLNLLLGDMQNGDSNIATIQAQITALS
jgi:hypothetical protein